MQKSIYKQAPRSIFFFYSAFTSLTNKHVLLFLLIVLFAIPGSSQSVFWTGQVSSDWNEPGNWGNSQVPDTNTNVTIINLSPPPLFAPVISDSATAQSVAVASGFQLNITATGSLTLGNGNGNTALQVGFLSTINNSGNIIIDGNYLRGISVGQNSTFNHLQGEISINGTIERGINVSSFDPDGIFNNYSTINIGNNSMGDIGIICSGGVFNHFSGVINIDHTTLVGIENNGSGIFNNESVINIGGNANVGLYGIRNLTTPSTFNNNVGTINIDRSSQAGILLTGGAFNNSADLNIGTQASVGQSGISYALGTFSNNAGEIVIDRASTNVLSPIGTFNNNSVLTVGPNFSGPNLINNNFGVFRNNAGGQLNGPGNITNSQFSFIPLNGSVLSPGNPIGIINYDAGVDIAGELNIDLNGAGVPGTDFDQVVVNGTADLFASLNVFINYTPTNGDQITILDATAITNTFSSVTGLETGWTLEYNFPNTGQVTLFFEDFTWNGAVDNDWQNPANWGGNTVPTSSADVVINSTLNAPVINSNAVARSLIILNGAELDIGTSGSLQIDGASTQGLLNQGTLNNQGLITIGGTSSVGQSGIINQGTFNHLGGEIKVDRSTFYAIQNQSGTFTSEANITIGGAAPVGIFGLQNDAIFIHNTGTVSIDNTSIGINCGANSNFTNQANIEIGSHSTIITGMLIGSNSVFNHNVGEITVNGSPISTAVSISGGTFQNNADFVIGNIESVGTLVSGSSGIFNLNAGGSLEGSGQIQPQAIQFNGGTLAPGNSPGIVGFIGLTSEDLTNSTLEIEVDGIGTPGVNFDQLIGANVTLGGILNLNINYTPAPNDAITFIDAISVTGTFSSVTGLSSGWELQYNMPTSGDVTLFFSGALPVELTSFVVMEENSHVLLEWSTSSETNNYGFEVQRSLNGIDWEKLDFIEGQGVSTHENHYSFLDEKIAPGLNFYRLRQIDFDGGFEYSEVRSVNIAKLKNDYSFYPNPASQYFFLESKSGVLYDGEITIFNSKGELVYQKSNIEKLQKIDLQELQEGIYTLMVKNGKEGVFSEQLMVVKR